MNKLSMFKVILFHLRQESDNCFQNSYINTLGQLLNNFNVSISQKPEEKHSNGRAPSIWSKFNSLCCLFAAAFWWHSISRTVLTLLMSTVQCSATETVRRSAHMTIVQPVTQANSGKLVAYVMVMVEIVKDAVLLRKTSETQT
ncbi:hypothetical protein Ocin01_13852 [Orchesella cincta]|uniref:Uncharacterized protein n=1 Tax=Orchesella cincta TaxID=48709 RepID=A0A1D2MJ79_ORCCI|nr:hypothetical protein Ocin01_13852 [Orchesella cincta]